MKIFLTGAFGNLGFALIKLLLARDYQVTCFDLPNPVNQKRAKAFASQVRLIWGDLSRIDDVKRAFEGHDMVIHLAALIPPYSETVPEKTMAVNFEGTKNLIESLPAASPFIFASTYDLFGHTNEIAPPRLSTDPIEISSHYTRSKAAAEEALKASALKWSILRFGSIIHIALDRFPAMAFELPVNQRLHVIHVEDAALAVANAVRSSEIWGKTLLIGGGADCQLYYGNFLNSMMEASGIGALPEAAFSQKFYTTDWLDTTESQALLDYQKRSFQTILDDTAALLGWRKAIMPLVRPFVRRGFLAKSAYLKRT